MGTIVELKYSNANNYISKLNQIDDKLELAYKQIAESTDFGSTAMQATWSFGSKKAIFNTLSDSKKIIKKIRQADKDLSKIISNLDDDYEKVAKKSKKQIETERWLTNHFSWVIPKKIYPSVIINPFITSFIVPGFIISPFQQIIQSIINPDFIPGNGSSDTGNNEGNTSNGNSANGNNSNGNTSNNNNSNGQTSSTTIPSTGRVDINNNYSIPDTQWSEITPHKTNAEGQRSPNAYNEVLAELDVANRKRYAPTDKSTWCNIYVWDATKAMGCEIPHYYDPNTGAPLTRDYCIKKNGSKYGDVCYKNEVMVRHSWFKIWMG